MTANREHDADDDLEDDDGKSTRKSVTSGKACKKSSMSKIRISNRILRFITISYLFPRQILNFFCRGFTVTCMSDSAATGRTRMIPKRKTMTQRVMQPSPRTLALTSSQRFHIIDIAL